MQGVAGGQSMSKCGGLRNRRLTRMNADQIDSPLIFTDGAELHDCATEIKTSPRMNTYKNVICVYQ
jgi:hypothetical protein